MLRWFESTSSHQKRSATEVAGLFLSDRTFDRIYYKTHIKAPLCSYHREALFFISILSGCLPAGKVGAYCGDLLGQVRAVEGGIRVKAVDYNTIIPCSRGGMNVLSIAKIERHMAGEIHQISHAHIRNMGRMDGVALFQLGIPPDGNTTQQVCHAAQAGAINARRGFAAPAVGRAKVALGCLGNGCTQLFLVLFAGLGVQRGQGDIVKLIL